MPLPSVYIQAVAVYGSDMKLPFVNVFWFQPQAALPADKNAFASAFATAFSTAIAGRYKDIIPTEASFFGVHVTATQDGLAGTGSDVSDAGPGLVAGDQLPDYSAAVVRKVTEIGGRTGRGRWFIGCIPESATNTDKLEGALYDEYETWAEQAASSYTVSGIICAPAHYSKKDGALYPIVQTVLSPYLVTQRRRRLRPVL